MGLRPVFGFLDKNNKFWNSRDEFDDHHYRLRLKVAVIECLSRQGNYNLPILNDSAIERLSNETLRAITNDLKVHI
jgi:hypothetical protein